MYSLAVDNYYASRNGVDDIGKRIDRELLLLKEKK
jgi:hypothetical protein